MATLIAPTEPRSGIGVAPGKARRSSLYIKWGLALGILLPFQMLALKHFPYASSYIGSATVSDADRSPGKSYFVVGQLEWNLIALAKDPKLEPFRKFYQSTCPGKTGLAAAEAIAIRFGKAFPFGDPVRDCFTPQYDPVVDLQTHLNGQQGHCVTRSALMCDTLLSVGIPARIVQLMRPGHNIVEVWDTRLGWTMIDPSYNGIVCDQNGPISAASAVDRATPFFWKSFGASPNFSASAPAVYHVERATRTPLMYPDPWIYTRSGPSAAPFPFRTFFVRVGAAEFPLGPLQAIIHVSMVCTALAALYLILFGLGRLRNQTPFHSTLVQTVPDPKHLKTERESVRVSLANLDPETVEGFGYEWSKFDQSALDTDELQAIFYDYFSIFPWGTLPQNAVGFDLGCGSGRWARLVAPRVGHLHCIDPSLAALKVAQRNLEAHPNCHFHLAGVDSIPLEENSADFGYSLGVLHHIPDTQAALSACVKKLKPGAPFLVYLYYAFDNRPTWFRFIWKLSDIGRFVISHCPLPIRYAVSQLIALTIYWPLARFARWLERRGRDVESMPLSLYRDRSLYVMRNDALDRFGTRLEQRFTRRQILTMMEKAGLRSVVFSEHTPFWCAVGIKQ